MSQPGTRLPGPDERPLVVSIVALDYYVARPGPGDSELARCSGKKLRQVPVIRIFGHTPTGQTACVHVHGVFPFFYIKVPPDLVENEDSFLHSLAEGLEKAMTMHQSALSPYGVRDPAAAYVYDLRWIDGWGSIYGASNGPTRFIQLWATVPQHPATMAHLLQQGAVMSSSFQPFEISNFFSSCLFRLALGFGAMGDLSLVQALGLELPSKSLLQRFGNHYLEPAVPVMHRLRRQNNAAPRVAAGNDQAGGNAARNPRQAERNVEDRG
eukprot:s341_g5.t1